MRQGETLTDEFVYRLSDITGALSELVTVTITVDGRNDNPVVGNDTYSLTEDTNLVVVGPGILGNDSDADAGSVLSVVDFNTGVSGVQPSQQPKFGTLVLNANGSFSYTPFADFSGTDSFEYYVSDSVLMSLIPATVTITVLPINDEPVFTAGGNITVNEDSGAYLQNWATGVQPAFGLNASPQTASDEASQTLTFVVLTNSDPTLFQSGPVIGSDGKVSFTSALNKSGSAILTVLARDNGSSISPNDNESSTKTFTINITAVNDPPLGVADNYNANEDALLVSSTSVMANDSDAENDSFSVVAANLTSAQGASVVLRADGSFDYDPRLVASLQSLVAGQNTADTFTYRLRDSSGAQSQPVTVTITVDGRNDSPVAVDDSFIVSPGVATILDVVNNDRDADNVFNVSLVTQQPGNGTVTFANGKFSYTPNAGFFGNDSFKYRLSDATGLTSNEATVSIRVNRAPVAVNDAAASTPNGSVLINVLSNDSDPDGNATIDTSSITIVTPSANGTATKQSNGAISFTPTPGFIGTTTFSYTIADSSLAVSNVAQVTINVGNAPRYQNPRNQYDVNDDGQVGPIDALIVINDIKRLGNRILNPTDFTPPPYLDVDGSNSVGPVDVLQVINYLNRQSRTASGEGEASRSIATAVPSMAFAATSNLSSGVSSIDVMPLTTMQAKRLLEDPVSRTSRQQGLNAAFGTKSSFASEGEETLVNSLASSSMVRKRSIPTDIAFAEAIDDELWG